ncbi:uncharacterized protein METZ01_LOCUS470283, partial [marine metagenome]
MLSCWYLQVAKTTAAPSNDHVIDPEPFG